MSATKTVSHVDAKTSAVPSAYCVKCKETREMKEPERIEMKNGRPATRGLCSVCGTKMFKIGRG